MPEPKTDTRAALEAWLQKNWKPPYNCPICKSNTWNLEGELFEVRAFRGGSLFVGGPLFPVAAVVCTTCGHTYFINALIAGIVQRPPPPAAPEQPGTTRVPATGSQG